jgi:ABC-type uncharacterized transport system YnjBCD ATPase subunit
MQWPQARSDAEQHLNTTFVTTAPRLDWQAENLSGGNLQRVVIARELSRNPKVLLAYYPARGLDVSNAEAMRAAFPTAARAWLSSYPKIWTSCCTERPAGRRITAASSAHSGRRKRTPTWSVT